MTCDLGLDEYISIEAGNFGADVMVVEDDSSYDRYEEMEFFEQTQDGLRVYNGYRSPEDDFIEF